MQINRINTQSFGMDITAKESFWADINYQIWCEPNNKNSKKLLKQIEKIQDYPLNDTYEIQKVSIPVKTNQFDNFIQNIYKLVNTTKNKIVFEQNPKQALRKCYNMEEEQMDFISSIAKNLKKFAKLEKLK